MLIRIYTPSDNPSCIEIVQSNTPKYFTAEEAGHFKIWLDCLDAGKPTCPNPEAEFFYVIEDNALVRGCGGFYKLREVKEARFAWGMIQHLEHGKSYGTTLTKYRIERIKELYPECKITLGTSQHTFNFFEKMGFHIEWHEKDGFGAGMDRYEMAYPV